MRISAGKASDFEEGKMKEVPLDASDEKSPKVLVSKVNGKLYATSAQCTHFGAPLVNGVLTKDCSIICPWHGAAFKCSNGDIEDAPGLGNLLSFSITQDSSSGEVFIEDVEELKKGFKRDPKGRCSKSADKGVVVVGGGSGGHHFVEEIRDAGYKGKVTVVMQEPHLPIDRTKLSKALMTDPGKLAHRDPSFYEGLDVKVLTDTTVTSLDLSGSSVQLSNSKTLPYSQLVLAPGSLAKTLPLPGGDLKGIFTLRNVNDAQKIDAAIGSGEKEKKKLVIVGSSFIGMEVAMATSKRADVHVVGMENAPFEAILGTQVGNGIRKFHESNGTNFSMSAQLDSFVPHKSDPSRVGAVKLKSGEELPADVVVLGVGAKPNTQLLKDAGLALEKDGSVVVDEHLRVKEVKGGNVFAVGDIATYPDLIGGTGNFRIEHWNVAGNHARHAARVIASSSKAGSTKSGFRKPAIFWSAQGQQLRYVGTAESSKWDDVWVDGDPDELKFVAYYLKKAEGKVVAVCSMQNDPVVSASSELFAQNRFPSADELKNGVKPLSLKL